MTTYDRCIRILLVDDHVAIRRGLRHLLGACADMAVVGEAGEAACALAAAASLSPDVVLLDVRLPGIDGFGLALLLRQAVPAARIIMLASFQADAQKAGVMCGSVDGCVWKSDADESLAEAIRVVSRGERWYSAYLRQAEA